MSLVNSMATTYPVQVLGSSEQQYAAGGDDSIIDEAQNLEPEASRFADAVQH